MQPSSSHKKKPTALLGSILFTLILSACSDNHFHNNPSSSAQAAPTEAVTAARAEIRSLGKNWDRDTYQKTMTLYDELQRQVEWPEMPKPQTIHYGSHPQQTLRLFLPEQEFSEPGTVGLFLYGDGLPSDEQVLTDNNNLLHNSGRLLPLLGGIGITMNYRSDPESSTLTAAEDIGLAIKWIRANIGAYGGDTDRFILIASSEGASYAASYLFSANAQPEAGPGITMALLSSGIFGNQTPHLSDMINQYTGEQTPLMLWSAEYDTLEVDAGIDSIYQALCDKYPQCPRYEKLAGHNHLSAILSLGTEDDAAFNSLVRFYHTMR